MKVILLSDIERLGHLGDEVIVAKGYARNYLLPQGHALLATPANIQFFEEKRAEYEKKVDELRSTANTLKASLDGKVVSISVRTGENNKLYGSVTTQMIADALKEENIDIDKRKILLDSPIRSLGEYPIRVRLHADIISEFTVLVISDRTELIDDIEEVAVEEKADESIIEVDENQ